MLRAKLTITLKLKGPVLTKSSAAGSYGIDSPMARTPDGKYCLPATLIKGRLRQAWLEIIEASGNTYDLPIDDYLGKTSGDSIFPGSVAPHRGALVFEDFVHNGARNSGQLYRIKIDETLGSVSKGAYQVIESPFAPGESAIFTGVVSYVAGDSQEAQETNNKIILGFKWISSLGAERTIGFGRLEDVILDSYSTTPCAVTALSPLSGNGAIGFKITARDPLCFALRKVNPNLFESDTVMSGAVLKGSLAFKWNAIVGNAGKSEVTDAMDAARPELCRHFDKIRFTHAFPAGADQARRPIVFPFSIVKDGPGNLYDVSLCEGPVLLGHPPSAPAFFVDWKSSDDAKKDFGWEVISGNKKIYDPPVYVRVRTALDRTTRRNRKEQLFAYEMVVPEGFAWVGNIDLSRIPDAERPAVESQLLEILGQELWGLGKTKADAKIEILPSPVQSYYDSHTGQRDGVWVVTIQTPALLCDAARLDETSGPAELKAAYADVWTQMSNGALELKHFLAAQSLAGGYYLHKRFQDGKPYNPYLLTQAGSVFVLTAGSGRESDAEAFVKSVLNQGLPVPDWAKQRFSRKGKAGDHWSNCPYIPENGFGEIVVNMDYHWDKRP